MYELLLFLPACFALNLTFGPNNLTAMTHAAQCGVRFAFLASLARIFVFVFMIAASALGMGVLLATSATAFAVLKIVGAAYLCWLGVKLLRQPGALGMGLGAEAARPDMASALKREALVALSNPKAILIFAAIFPQFVDTTNYYPSYAIHGVIFLILEAVAIAIYAVIGRFAASAGPVMLTWFQRGSGVGMLVFGVLLLLSKQPGQT